MKTVHEVSKLTGVSIRALHYYDRIGLLHPAQVTEAGYRLYDDANLERLQSILLFRELKFSLKEIRCILDSSGYDRDKMLEQQIQLLRLQKEHLENLIELACEIKTTGVKIMDFSAFDTSKIDEYAKQAKEAWGDTAAYKEYEEKNRIRTQKEEKMLGEGLMQLFVELGKMKQEGKVPSDETVQQQVGRLQSYITEHYYTCTPEILQGLGCMYSGGGEMTENIDRASGKGTGEFAGQAIQVFCEKK
ncbi:MAG: MerR family transcriptional regulator [Lachnospiraceae bacterium]|nr:MerR family transcriptional regulator [Lachnospiraceae bacterium]